MPPLSSKPSTRLYRIHLRPAAAGLEERFEYVVSGTETALGAWLAAARTEGACVSETRITDTTAYALVLSPIPLEIPTALSPVSFDALRAGDRSGALSWLWNRVDQGRY